jgi:hypothetical protein
MKRLAFSWRGSAPKPVFAEQQATAARSEQHEQRKENKMSQSHFQTLFRMPQ